MLRNYSCFLVDAANGKRSKIKNTVSGYFRTNALVILSGRYNAESDTVKNLHAHYGRHRCWSVLLSQTI